MNRKTLKITLFSLFIYTCGLFSQQDAITQFSTINALLNGLYDGQFTFEEVKQYGNFGIGTFAALDGEMILLNDTVYQVTSEGKINRIDNTTETPFSITSFFKADTIFNIKSCGSIENLKTKLNENLVSENLFYAVKIKGLFSFIKTRSVPAQQKPYPPLAEAAKNQSIFLSEKRNGWLVGYYCPEYIKGINVPGFHLHFLSDDKTFGGHVLDLKIEKAVAEIDIMREFKLILPKDSEFEKIDLKEDKEQELKQVEQNK